MKTKQETNFIGAMLLALVFFLLLNTALQISLTSRTIKISEFLWKEKK